MPQHTPEPEAKTWLDIVQQRAGAIRFGSIQIIVHEGRVTYVESTEKTRLGGDLAAISQARN